MQFATGRRPALLVLQLDALSRADASPSTRSRARRPTARWARPTPASTCLPTTKGIDAPDHQRPRLHRRHRRDRSGRDRASASDEFQQRAFYYYENWESLYAQWKDKMRALIADAQALPKPVAARIRAARDTCTPASGIASNHALLDIYQKTLEGYFRMWHHHFEFLLLGYGAYMTFFDFCKKAFPEISDQTIARMVAGMEAEIFRPDDELRRLARAARCSWASSSPSRTASASTRCSPVLEGVGTCGREVARGARDLAHPWFNVNVGDGFYHYHRSLERRPVAAVLGAARLHPPDQGRRPTSSARSRS